MLVRHGETEWSRDGRHTGRTDVPLTEHGRTQAASIAPRLLSYSFSLVLTSPLSRAADTCALAGEGDRAVTDDDLLEWDYGQYEGITTAEIRETHPGWTVFDGPVPGGENPEQVGGRADRVLERAERAGGDVLLVGHGHMSRVIAARWLGLAATDARLFALSAGSLSILGHEREQRVLSLWNDTSHLSA